MAILITADLWSHRAVNAILAFGIFNIPVCARDYPRRRPCRLWQREFILAARVAGKNARARISVEHILPNVSDLLIVQGTIQFALGVQVEAALSALLAWVSQPPTPSPWGRMLADAQTLVTIAPHIPPWSLVWPMVLTVSGAEPAG